MDVAVTGGSGHIGANLVRALLARGDRVRVLVRQHQRGQAPPGLRPGAQQRGQAPPGLRPGAHDDSLAGLGIERVEGDVRDAAALSAAFDGVECAFHLAAQIAIGGVEDRLVDEINVEGTRGVLAACRAARVRRLVHFSSIHALSPLPRDRPVDEGRALVEDGHGTPYDRSKAKAERLVIEAARGGVDVVTVNPTGVIGPHDYRPSVMGTVLLDMYRRRFPALVDGGFNWVDARDVADGAIAAAERGRPGERYLLSGEWRTLRDVAALVEEVTGSRPAKLVAPMWLARAVAPLATGWNRLIGRPPRLTRAALKALRDHRDVRNDKARAELGYAPRPIRRTIEETFNWFRERGVI